MKKSFYYIFRAVFCYTGVLIVDGAITWTTPAGGDVTKTDINEGATGRIYPFVATATGALTYTIFSQSVANTFTINSGTGSLSLATGKKLDFETNPTHVIKVRVVEAAAVPVTSTGTLTIQLADVNEPPTFTYSSVTKIIEDGTAAGSVISTEQCTDQDAGDVLTHSFMSGNSKGHFVIGSTSGVITIASGTTLTDDTKYTLVIKCIDNDAKPASGTTTMILCVGTCSGAGALLYTSLLMLFCALITQFL